MMLEPVNKFLEKDEKILWSLENKFETNLKFFKYNFLIFYVIFITLFFIIYSILFIQFENISQEEIQRRYTYFLIFVITFSLITFLASKKFPIKIPTKYFLTNLRLISLYYGRAEFGGYKIKSYKYENIENLKIQKNLNKEFFEVSIYSKNEILEDSVILDTRGLEILKEKISK